MKICQLCNLDSTMFHFLLPLMLGLRNAGHEVVGVCAPGPFVDKVERHGFRVETVNIERSFNIFRHAGAVRELQALFRSEAFDIAHVHNPVAAMVGRYAAWRAGIPRIVYTAHGFYFHEHMPWPPRAAFIGLEWLAGRVTDVLFTQAQEDADTARRLGLIAGKTIQAIGNGVDPAKFHDKVTAKERSAKRRKLGAPDDRVAIMTVGRLVAEKGFPELIEAMREVDAELWIVGERLKSDHAKSIEPVLAAMERDPVLSERVKLLGYRPDIPDLLRAADIFVLASHREGMPRSIVEAMMCGLPVVSTDVRGSREEVIDGETGLLVPVRDRAALAQALAGLAGDGTRRKAMGRAGRERALALYDEQKVIARQFKALGL